MAGFVRGNQTGRMTSFVGGHFSQISTYASVGGFHGVMLSSTPMPSMISKNTTDGNPSSPCLSVDYPGSWRFRWVVKPGPRAIYIQAKQNSTGSVYRPSLIVKANPNVGLMADISGSAANGANWVQIGPVSFTSTGTDVVWVEMWNNNYSSSLSPALFDHIITT